MRRLLNPFAIDRHTVVRLRNLEPVAALAALVIAIATLYLTVLQGPHFTVCFGPKLHLFTPTDGGFAVITDVSFTNTGSRMGVVLSTALTMKRHPSDETYGVAWDTFRAYRETEGHYELKLEQEAVPIPVLGRSSVTKLVRFLWGADTERPLVLEEGSYQVDLQVWTSGSGKPDVVLTQELEVTHADAEEFRRRAERHDSKAITRSFVGAGPVNVLIPTGRASDLGPATPPCSG